MLAMRWLFLSIALLAGVVYSQEPIPAPAKGIQQQKAKAEKSQQKTAKDEIGTEKLPAVIKIIPAPNADEIAKKQEQYEKEKATKENLTAWATVALAFITLCLAFYTARLWRATVELGKEAKAISERQEREMRQSLAIASKSADAARDAADAMTDANIPYLAPELKMGNSSLASRPSGSYRPTVRYVFKNYGKSPATLIEFSDYLIMLNDLPPDPIYPPHALEVDREVVIGADAESREFPCGLVANTVTWEPQEMTTEEIRAEKRVFFLIGRVVYDDPFELRHTKHYCYRFEVSPTFIGIRPDGDRRYNLRTKTKSPYAKRDQ